MGNKGRREKNERNRVKNLYGNAREETTGNVHVPWYKWLALGIYGVSKRCVCGVYNFIKWIVLGLYHLILLCVGSILKCLWRIVTFLVISPTRKFWSGLKTVWKKCCSKYAGKEISDYEQQASESNLPPPKAKSLVNCDKPTVQANTTNKKSGKRGKRKGKKTDQGGSSIDMKTRQHQDKPLTSKRNSDESVNEKRRKPGRRPLPCSKVETKCENESELDEHLIKESEKNSIIDERCLCEDFQRRERDLELKLQTKTTELDELKTTNDGLRENVIKMTEDLRHSNEEINELKSINDDLQCTCGEKERELKCQCEKMYNLQEQIKTVTEESQGKITRLTWRLDKEKETVRSRDNEIARLRMQNKQLDEEKHDALTRLSKMVSVKLRDNNPNIVDLNDQFRPTKLGEMFSELYDNEWTDAFTYIEEKAGMNDTVIVEFLLDIVMLAYYECEDLLQESWKILDKWYLDDTFQTSKTLKDNRKNRVQNQVEEVQQSFTENVRQECVSEINGILDTADMIKYIRTCIQLCLLMNATDPPVVLVCHGWKPLQDRRKPALTSEGDIASENKTTISDGDERGATSACNNASDVTQDASNKNTIARNIDARNVQQNQVHGNDNILSECLTNHTQSDEPNDSNNEHNAVSASVDEGDINSPVGSHNAGLINITVNHDKQSEAMLNATVENGPENSNHNTIQQDVVESSNDNLDNGTTVENDKINQGTQISPSSNTQDEPISTLANGANSVDESETSGHDESNQKIEDQIKRVDFNKDMYREFTSRGPFLDYVVWPVMLLHKEGSMLSKGVAQGTKTQLQDKEGARITWHK